MKIEIGNFVRRKSDGKIVEKVISKDGWVSYLEDRKTIGSCPMEEVENVDVKTAFLTRLQELLATFDATIDVRLDYRAIENVVVLLDNDVVAMGRTITAENVFDYDKE